MATYRLDFERKAAGKKHVSEIELYQNGVDNFTFLIRNRIGEWTFAGVAVVTKADMLDISDLLRREAMRPES